MPSAFQQISTPFPLLEKIDRELLLSLDLNCREPLTRLSKRLGKTRQVLEYRIKRLESIGVIKGFSTAFSPGKMGYHLYKIHVKLREIPEERERLIQYLKSLGNVYWYGLCSGAWDLLIGLFYHSDFELFPVTQKLNSEFRKVVVEAKGHNLVTVLQYPKMFLTGKVGPPYEYMGKVAPSEMEPLDYKILVELVENARIPITELAEKVGSTPAIVKSHLQKMEQSGIVIQHRITIDFKKLGLTYFKTLIELNRYNEQDHLRFTKYVSKVPSVIYFLRNLWSIELEIVAENFDRYDEIIRGITHEFPFLIRSLDTLVIHEDEWTPGFRNLLR